AVTAGGGALSAASATTDAAGRASTTLTLGSSPGTNMVTASASSLSGSPVAFMATGTPAPATQIALASGNDQTGTVGTAIAPFAVSVKDAAGMPVSGFIVTFAVTQGGGTLSASSVATDASGLASATLTLGRLAGTNLVSASAMGLAGSPITF